jgi:hypothetical protein
MNALTGDGSLAALFTQASYNRKYFRIFAIAVLVAVGFVVLVNALFLIGWLKL